MSTLGTPDLERLKCCCDLFLLNLLLDGVKKQGGNNTVYINKFMMQHYSGRKL